MDFLIFMMLFNPQAFDGVGEALDEMDTKYVIACLIFWVGGLSLLFIPLNNPIFFKYMGWTMNFNFFVGFMFFALCVIFYALFPVLLCYIFDKITLRGHK